VSDELVVFPIDGVLDLHTFHPSDVKDVVEEYLKTCSEVGIYEVRIIHGKGKGVQRNIVRSLLSKLPWVKDFRDAEVQGGGWGATLVNIASEIE